MRFRPNALAPLFFTALASFLVASLGVPAAGAEETTGLMAAEEEMVQQMLKPRAIEDLNAELEAAKRRAVAADAEVAEASQLLTVARARVDVKKGEIAVLGTRLKLARKEGDTAGRAEVEKILAREQSGLKVFEAMRDAAKAQRDRAEAAADFSRARMKSQEAEIDLVRKRDARLAESLVTGVSADPAKLGRLDDETRKAARATLHSLRDYAKSSKRLAEATGDLAKARLDLLDAWESYKGP